MNRNRQVDRWYSRSDKTELIRALQSLHLDDRSRLGPIQIRRFVRDIESELGFYRDTLSIEIQDMLALLPPNERNDQGFCPSTADEAASKYLRDLSRHHSELTQITASRTPRARLRYDLKNLKAKSTTIRSLLRSPQDDALGSGRRVAIERTYKRELVLALRFGSRKACIVSPSASRVLVLLDQDSDALASACEAVLDHWVVRGHRQNIEPSLESLRFGLLDLYKTYLNKPPAYSAYKPEGKPERPCPTVRYLCVCLGPLGAAPTMEACRKLIRRYRRFDEARQERHDVVEPNDGFF